MIKSITSVIGGRDCVVTAVSELTGKLHNMLFPLSKSELGRRIIEWRNTDKLVCAIFPDLSHAHREFLMTGITPDEWATLLPEPEEDDDES